MKVNEIFTSIQGEGLRAGLPCTFVRFTACDLRCTYCDTEYAFHAGNRWTLDALVDEVRRRAVPLVCVTGGEPMLQKDILPFLQTLVDASLTVLLETGGHRELTHVPRSVVRIVDIKTPGAFAADAGPDLAKDPTFARSHFHPANFDCLYPHDELKVVVTSRFDFDWAIAFLCEHHLTDRVAQVHVSPGFEQVSPRELAEWILQSRLPLRLNLQLHKYVWGPDARGV